MGRGKLFRQRLHYQVESVRRKTLQSQLRVQLQKELGMSHGEAELLSMRLNSYVHAQREPRGPEQVLMAATAGRAAFQRRPHGGRRQVQLTPVAPEDLDVHEEFGLAAMQRARLLRLIEEAYAQDALVSARQLGALLNLTPTALRQRLQTLRQAGLWVPVAGLSRREREMGGLLRSSWLLAAHLQGASLIEARETVGCSRSRWQEIQTRFARMGERFQAGPATPRDPEEAEWLRLWPSPPATDETGPEVPRFGSPAQGSWRELAQELARDFGFPPVKIRAVREILLEVLETLGGNRPPGALIYWAVAAEEPAGKPLDACRLVPVTLTLLAEEDLLAKEDNRDLNRMSDLKRTKILRYATQAKQQGAYLTYADLGYLLGIHTEALRRLIETEPHLVVPLRGSERDIGRGVTHRQRIIELYLQMHTETEIVARTGHSYAAIENYLREFATVFVLWERGMPAPLIRRVTQRSLKLVNTYLALIEAYHIPAYAFRFHQLRKFHERHDGKKGALGGGDR